MTGGSQSQHNGELPGSGHSMIKGCNMTRWSDISFIYHVTLSSMRAPTLSGSIQLGTSRLLSAALTSDTTVPQNSSHSCIHTHKYIKMTAYLRLHQCNHSCCTHVFFEHVRVHAMYHMKSKHESVSLEQ